MRCCKGKDRRVSAKHGGFLKACRALNLPTLKDMAIRNARVLIKQWCLYEPELFIWDEQSVVGIADESNRLLTELFELSRQQFDVWLEDYEAARRNKSIPRLSLSKFPLWYQNLKAARKAHTPRGPGPPPPPQADVIDTYVLLFRYHFNTLEPSAGYWMKVRWCRSQSDAKPSQIQILTSNRLKSSFLIGQTYRNKI